MPQLCSQKKRKKKQPHHTTAEVETKIEADPARMPEIPWNADFKFWLDDHGGEALVHFEETLPQRACPQCLNKGVCNLELGACDCPSGYTGDDCSRRDPWLCNLPDAEAANRSVKERYIGTMCVPRSRASTSNLSVSAVAAKRDRLKYGADPDSTIRNDLQ
eukprot:gene25142-30678_t